MAKVSGRRPPPTGPGSPRLLAKTAPTLAALAALIGLGCNNEPSAANPEAPTEAKNKGGSSMKAGIERAVRDHWDGAEFDLEIVDDKTVSGLAVFRAHKPSSTRGRPGRYTAGVARGDVVALDKGEARKLIIAAAGYGPRRTLTAAQLANLLGPLEGGSRHSAAAIVDASDLTGLGEAWKGKAALPKDVEVDGKPGIEYFATGTGESFLWKSTAVVEADGSLSVSRQEIH